MAAGAQAAGEEGGRSTHVARGDLVVGKEQGAAQKEKSMAAGARRQRGRRGGRRIGLGVNPAPPGWQAGRG
jgi:hypothetical protein